MIENVNSNFTQIPNQVIDDNELSDRAKVVYVKMRRCGPSWTFSVRGLAKILRKSSGTVARGLKELIEKGYVERDQTRDPCNRFGRMNYNLLNNPHAEIPHSDNACSQEMNNREYSSVCNNISSNTFRMTDCLSVDVGSFEQALRRKIVPTEMEICERWQKESEDPQFIWRAFKDNEYRRDKLDLKHVDETIKRWKEKGLTTIKQVENDILDTRYQNLVAKIRADLGDEADEEAISEKISATQVGIQKHWRDNMMQLYRDKDPVFERMAANCPTNVFIYLPDEVLNAMIIVFEGENASDKINAAKAAITNEMR